MSLRRKTVSAWRRAVLAVGGTVNEQPEPDAPTRRMRTRSEKRAKLYREERAPLVASLVDSEARWVPCDGGWRIKAWIDARGREGERVLAFAGCAGRGSHPHEVVTRGRGGSITDAGNVVPLCHVCHAWVHEHPRVALALGLLATGAES